MIVKMASTFQVGDLVNYAEKLCLITFIKNTIGYNEYDIYDVVSGQCYEGILRHKIFKADAELPLLELVDIGSNDDFDVAVGESIGSADTPVHTVTEPMEVINEENPTSWDECHLV